MLRNLFKSFSFRRPEKEKVEKLGAPATALIDMRLFDDSAIFRTFETKNGNAAYSFTLGRHMKTQKIRTPEDEMLVFAYVCVALLDFCKKASEEMHSFPNYRNHVTKLYVGVSELRDILQAKHTSLLFGTIDTPEIFSIAVSFGLIKNCISVSCVIAIPHPKSSTELGQKVIVEECVSILF